MSETKRRADADVSHREINSRNHRKRMEEIQRPAELKQTHNGTGEAEVVPTYQLAAVIRAWSKRFLIERPLSHKPTGVKAAPQQFVGPVDWLSSETGLSNRQISRITSEEQTTTSLAHADKLLMAIDREYMLSNGEIQVVPNPNWSTEKWVAHMQERGCY